MKRSWALGAAAAVALLFAAGGWWQTDHVQTRAAHALRAAWVDRGKALINQQLVGQGVVGGSFVNPDGTIQSSPEDLTCFRYSAARSPLERKELCFTQDGRLVELLHETPRGTGLTSVLPNVGWAPVSVPTAAIARARTVAANVEALARVVASAFGAYTPCAGTVNQFVAHARTPAPAAAVRRRVKAVAKACHAAAVGELSLVSEATTFRGLPHLLRKFAATAEAQAKTMKTLLRGKLPNLGRSASRETQLSRLARAIESEIAARQVAVRRSLLQRRHG
jgi:hypothetical protein